MIDQGTQVIFTPLNSPKCPKRNVPGGENCQTFWMVIFSIQFWSWCCQRAEIGRKCDYFVWIGTDKRKESDDADENLRRGEVEVELAQLGNNGRTECGQWIPPSHISLSSKLANTLLVDICWWKCFGGKIFTEASRHRSEGLSKFYWRYLSAFPWDDSRKIDKVNNLAGLPGDGGEVLVGGEDGNVGKLETGAATEVLGQVAGQVVRGRKGINNIWGIWWLAEGSIGAAFYFDGLLNVCILTISLMSLKMDPKVNLTESLPLKVREIQRVGRLSMFWSWFDFQLRGGLGLLSYLSDCEATKTLGGSGAFCFITWKWDTLPLLFGKSISSLLPLSHWILSCCFLLSRQGWQSWHGWKDWQGWLSWQSWQGWKDWLGCLACLASWHLAPVDMGALLAPQ